MVSLSLEQSFVDKLQFYLERIEIVGLPSIGIAPSDPSFNHGFKETKNRHGAVYDQLNSIREDFLDSLQLLATGNTRQQQCAYQFIINMMDFLLVCSYSTPWKELNTRVHALDDLYTALANSFEPWKYIKWTPLPAQIHKDGFPFVLPALAASVWHSCLVFGNLGATIDSTRIKGFLEKIMGYVIGTSTSFPSDPLSPVNLIIEILDDSFTDPAMITTPPGVNINPLRVSSPTGELYPRIQDDYDAAQIMAEITKQLKTDPGRRVFSGWSGALWLAQIVKEYDGSDYHLFVKKRLKDCYHWHLSNAVSRGIVTQTQDNIRDLTKQDLTYELSQDCFWRVYRSGHNVFRATQGSDGRYTLPIRVNAGTLYIATTADCAMVETFDSEPILRLIEVADRSLALIRWEPPPTNKPTILDIEKADRRPTTTKSRSPFIRLPWDQAQKVAKAAHSNGFEGIRYASAKGTTDMNIALFTYGPYPSKHFRVERTRRLVSSREFWAYIARRSERTVCFTRLPDDVTAIHPIAATPLWPE